MGKPTRPGGDREDSRERERDRDRDRYYDDDDYYEKPRYSSGKCVFYTSNFTSVYIQYSFAYTHTCTHRWSQELLLLDVELLTAATSIPPCTP